MEAQNSQPLVTVNILSYNRRDELRITLQKLTSELEYPAERIEIIVVDNASTDGTRDMIATEFSSVRLIATERNEGISGWNRGFDAGHGEYFLVLDDDCYISGDSLLAAVDAANERQADLVSFQVTTRNSDGVFVQPFYNLGLLGFWGCAVLISRRAVHRLGGFDRNIFIWAHEVEFTMRLLDAGLTHLYLPQVVSRHMKPPGKGGAAMTPEALATITPRLDLFFERTNRGNFGYIAGKLMCLPHALATLANLLTDVLILLYHFRSRDVLKVGWAILAGFGRGLQNRQPVRWSVSRIYSKNFVDFANPLLMLRKRPRRPSFTAERPAYYPSSEAALRVA